MNYVVPIGREPLRAIVIRRSTGDRFVFTVSVMQRRPGTLARHLGHAYGADTLLEAWKCARTLAQDSGLPIIDAVSPPRRGPRGPGGGGGERIAA